MTQQNAIARGLLRGSTALSALAILGGGFAASTIIATPASAQEYTAGAISGTVTNDAGAPVNNAVVTVRSLSRGFTRTTTTGSNGGFRVTGLPSGDYDVMVEAPGADSFRATQVRVLASQTSDLTIGLTTTGNSITVLGASIVDDFSGTTTGLVVDLEELVKTVPIGRDLTSVVLLAPGTTEGDSAFGSLASIGGSSVAENAYYINGLNITNFDNYLGSAEVPFEFYRTVEVKSGGYPAEFGRATGGIVNSVSKSGSNDFMAAVHLNWVPDFLTSAGKDLLTCNFDAAGDRTCAPLTNRPYDERSSYSAIVEAGGPIIRDRLFVYGLVEFQRSKSRVINRNSGVAFDSENNDPFFAVKVDAYPLDNHHLEFTLFDTSNTTVRRDLIYNEPDGEPTFGAAQGIQETNGGGVNYVAQYTGTFTDWLTLSAAYGRMRDRFDNQGVDVNSGLPFFQNASGGPQAGVPFGGLFTNQTVLNRSFPHRIEREFYRADVDLFFNLLGDHHVRAGFDRENNSLTRATVRTGGDYLFGAGFITEEAYNAGAGGAGVALVSRPGGEVQLSYFNSGGTFEGVNKAYYIQDEWNVTDRLTLNLGVRRDDFKVNAADGSPFASLSKNYAPRLGISYDLWPDQNGKVYAFYGQYFLPFASNTAFRNTGSEIFFSERYMWDGVSFDSAGLPVLGPQVTTQGTYQSACPFRINPMGSGNFCAVTGDGSVPPSDAYLASNLQATRETEWILGYEHDFGEWTAGINYIHRNLDVTAEDGAIDAAVLTYCEEEGIAGCEDVWTGFHQYVLFNPGEEVTVVLLDADNEVGLQGREVTFTADEIGYPKARRKYDAVELTFRREWRGDWSLGGSYTWSKSKGNSEGFVQSDFGQDDAGITQDFDQPGFTDFAYGYLPNHRTHRIKLFGAVALSDRFTLGTNIRIDSPRKLSCFGFHPTDVFGNVYGAASHFCGGEPAPRGEGSESDWIKQVNLSGRYNIEMATGQVLTLRADVFNLFNSQGVEQRNEFGDLDTDTDPLTGRPTFYYPNPNYDLPSGYQSPRFVRLGVDITF